MTILVNEHIHLELINITHAATLFNLVHKNRQHLRTWLPFVNLMQDISFAENFIQGTMIRNQNGTEYAFIIYEHNQAVGRIGMYHINQQNAIGEIGYWLISDAQSRGIITNCCKTLIAYCFNTLKLNRIEIKCATLNTKSIGIPKRLGFTQEAVLREAELLHGAYVDLYLFSLLKREFMM
jgi:ribosomal-protein-serine acetyltransferase